MPGILESLGSFGRRIIDVVRETGRSIADAITIARPIAPEVTEPDVLRDWGKVTRITERESLVAALPGDQAIPDYLYTTSDVPFKRPYAYTVQIYGRAVAGREGPGGIKIGGRFTRDEFNITSSRPLTPDEVEDEAMRRFGAAGAYPLISIYRMSTTAAMRREI